MDSRTFTMSPATLGNIKVLATLGLFFIFSLTGCQPKQKSNPIDFGNIENLIHSNELGKAEDLCNSLKQNADINEPDSRRLDSLTDICHRIRIDFRLDETEVIKRLSEYFPNLDTAMMRNWEKNLKLEMRVIDGQKRYFKNAVSNLFLLDDEARKQKEKIKAPLPDSHKDFRIQHSKEVISSTKKFGEATAPVKTKLSYVVELKADAVPDGETVRCWLPFPREGSPRQKNIRLISTEPSNPQIAPADAPQRTVYVEKKAVKGQPTVFSLVMEVETSAQYFDLKPEMAKPYDTESALYKEFTAERQPHIAFSPKIRELAKQIVADETNPILRTWKIYNWIDNSIRWASALEYGTMPNIPEYVLETNHGDCGMQTLLLISMLRSLGIPAKWQSGWMLHPDKVNLHDWGEVYFEGIGWVPIDQSFGLQNSPDEKIKNFYRNGIDSYRLIVNDDYGRQLIPAKKFFRSEPCDFQRGELEWAGGNLYFNLWDYNMTVEYIK